MEARVRKIEAQAIPVLSAEDIVTFKILLDRGKDWPDVESVLAVQGRAFDLDYVRHWLVEMIGADDSRVARLHELARQTWERTDHIQ